MTFPAGGFTTTPQAQGAGKPQLQAAAEPLTPWVSLRTFP